MNRLALSWVDTCLGLEEDYRKLWSSYCDLQRAYLLLLARLHDERELRAWAASEIEARFPEERAA